jgi:transcriptional regulator with XRE-family HTH domain
MTEQAGADGVEQASPAPTTSGLPGLRPARVAKLLTQRELAQVSGLSRLTISELEGGLRNAHLRTIRQLAAVLEVSPQELLRTAQPALGPIRERRPRRAAAPPLETT